MNEKLTNTPDQGADRSADRKPREVRGDLIGRLKKRAAALRVASVTCDGAHYEDIAQYGMQTLAYAEDLDEAATALAAQDARIKELERQKSFWENETWKVVAERDARDVCIKDLEKALHQTQGNAMNEKEKPYQGRIIDWYRISASNSYYIIGLFLDHPNVNGEKFGNTSIVISHNHKTGEIETRNSRYRLLGNEKIRTLNQNS